MGRGPNCEEQVNEKRGGGDSFEEAVPNDSAIPISHGLVAEGRRSRRRSMEMSLRGSLSTEGRLFVLVFFTFSSLLVCTADTGLDDGDLVIDADSSPPIVSPSQHPHSTVTEGDRKAGSVLRRWQGLAEDSQQPLAITDFRRRRTDSDGRERRNDSESNYRARKPSIRAVHLSCYSCMSSEFEKYWTNLRHIYNQPKNFSDLCLDMPRKSRIGMVPCESACLTVLERRYSGGRPSGYNVIRGCLSNVFKYYSHTNGGNAKLISLRRKTAVSRRTACEDTDARDLLPQIAKENGERMTAPSASSTRSTNPLFRAQLCTCYGELCNNQALSGASRWRSRLHGYLLLVLLNAYRLLHMW